MATNSEHDFPVLNVVEKAIRARTANATWIRARDQEVSIGLGAFSEMSTWSIGLNDLMNSNMLGDRRVQP